MRNIISFTSLLYWYFSVVVPYVFHVLFLPLVMVHTSNSQQMHMSVAENN